MTTWNLDQQEAAAAVNGKLTFVQTDGRESQPLRGIGTDTRKDLSGLLFIALKGDTHDAHDHLVEAVKSGAEAVLIHRDFTSEQAAQIAAELEQRRRGLAVIRVADTLKAIQDLALYWRRKNRATVFGITGTNGKTSTKEFLAAILSTRFKTHYSKGSFNNHWGVPMSLLSIHADHDIAVIEMGMNHLGELKDLSRIVEADAVACTMVGRGHLEGVGSVEGVAAAKSEIYEFAKPRADFIFNLDNPHTRGMLDRFTTQAALERKIVTFSSTQLEVQFGGSTRAVDVRLKVLSETEHSLEIEGRIGEAEGRVVVPVYGKHNVTNLMTAASFALLAGMHGEEIWKALPNCRSTWGRNEWRTLETGARVLFDAYNANPESMRAALENAPVLKKSGGRVFAVLGEMRELGEYAKACHEEIGRLAARAGFEAILFFGESAAHFRAGFEAESTQSKKTAQSDESTLVTAEKFDSAVWSKFQSRIASSDVVLVKASRGVGLEKIFNGAVSKPSH